jgi:hypothetical protein
MSADRGGQHSLDGPEYQEHVALPLLLFTCVDVEKSSVDAFVS